MKMIGAPRFVAIATLFSAVLLMPSTFANEGKVIDATDSSFAKEIRKAKGPVFVDFYATWCAPCKQMAPVVDDLSSEFGGKVKFVRIDVDRCPKTAQKYQIEVIPTFDVFKKGKIVATKSGLVPKEDLKAKISEAL